jgi:GNAT superfamily N-acetyltransferase
VVEAAVTGLRFHQVKTITAAKELYARFMPGDYWCGDDHAHWALHEPNGAVVAFCSAVYRPGAGYVYLSSAGVLPTHRGGGVQRRLIRHRLRWGQRQGATRAVTYTLLHNYASIANLLKCGFRFAAKPRGWPGVQGDVHYFERDL